jgi:hypothetical protein
LQNAADSAALAAAETIDVPRFHTDRGVQPAVDVDAARRVAIDALRDLDGYVRVEISSSSTGVSIRLSTGVPTTFLGLIGVERLRVVADSTARPVFGSVGS